MSSTSGRGKAIKESLDLPEQFKEEERFFSEVDSIIKDENERGLTQKMLDVTLYGSLKVTLLQIHEMINKNMVNEEILDMHLRHYMKKGESPVCQHLKAISKMLIDQARRPGQSAGTQVVLLFKTIDCLRMYSQYSPKHQENVAAFLILQIMAKMPKAFIPHMNREKFIFQQTLALQRALKEGAPGVDIKNKLANAYTQQRCYSDALYQYESILEHFARKKPQTPADREKMCVIHLNIVEFYKQIYDYNEEYKNGQILSNLMYRYNREADTIYSHRKNIPIVRGPINKMTLSNFKDALEKIALDHNMKALALFPPKKNRRKRSELLETIARMNLKMKQPLKALGFFQDSLLMLGKERNNEEIFQAKEEVLELMRKCIKGLSSSSKLEQIKSFVIQEENKLEADREEWAESQQRKQDILDSKGSSS